MVVNGILFGVMTPIVKFDDLVCWEGARCTCSSEVERSLVVR